MISGIQPRINYSGLVFWRLESQIFLSENLQKLGQQQSLVALET